MFINAEKAPLRRGNLNVNKLFSQFKVNKLRHYLRYIPYFVLEHCQHLIHVAVK